LPARFDVVGARLWARGTTAPDDLNR
jgi:hypothetical protein